MFVFPLIQILRFSHSCYYQINVGKFTVCQIDPTDLSNHHTHRSKNNNILTRALLCISSKMCPLSIFCPCFRFFRRLFVKMGVKSHEHSFIFFTVTHPPKQRKQKENEERKKETYKPPNQTTNLLIVIN